MTVQPRAVVERYFGAMKRGADAEDDLLDLFAADAVYSEPFSGEQREFEGRPAIVQCFRDGWQGTPTDLELTVERIDVEGQVVTSHWTCTSPAFPAPVKGRDVCTVRDGLIQHLDVRIVG
jgi:ketosteroid isomerase-like protein